MVKPSFTFRRNQLLAFTVVAIALASVSGCDPREPAQYNGLDTVRLYIDSRGLSKLQNGTYTKTSAGAEIIVAGQRFVGDLSYAGQSSVDDLKKSWNIDLNVPYGERTRYRLSAMSRDPSALRAMLSYRVFDLVGADTPTRRYVSVFLNGESLGLYILHEKIDEEFFWLRGRQATRIYAARGTRASMETSATVAKSFTSRLGSHRFADLERLVSLIAGLPSPENRRDIERYLDVNSVIRYMAVSAIIDNSDGINNNYILARTYDEPRFAIYPWDLDYTFHDVAPPEDGALFRRNAMMRRFFYDEPEYRERYDHHRTQAALAIQEADLSGRGIEELAAPLGFHFANDPVLGQQSSSLDDQVSLLRKALAAQTLPATVTGSSP